jgi:hypothetical protein
MSTTTANPFAEFTDAELSILRAALDTRASECRRGRGDPFPHIANDWQRTGAEITALQRKLNAELDARTT